MGSRGAPGLSRSGLGLAESWQKWVVFSEHVFCQVSARSCGAPGRPGWPLVGLLGFPGGPLVVPVGPLRPLDPLPFLLNYVIQVFHRADHSLHSSFAVSTHSDFLNIPNQPAGNTEFFSLKIEEHDKQSALNVPLCRILLPFIQGHFYPGKTGVCKPWATWSFC